MSKSVSVIIPSFNGKELLEENLPFVIRSLVEFPRSEIIIVDDASTDDSIDFLKRNYPEIRVIKNVENIGFGPSINAGLKEANHDLVLLLNNDIKLDKKYISTSLKYFTDPDTFGVMGIIKDELSGVIMEGIKWPMISVSGLSYKDLRMPEIKNWDEPVFTFYVCGGNAIVDREKMLELQGFQDIYHPFYMEDVDLSIRAWLSGWKLYFNPEAKCYHKHSVTINKYYSMDYVNIISKRNRLILSHLYLSGYKKLLFRISTYIKSVYYKLLHSLKLSPIYQGYRDFFSMQGKLGPYQIPMNKKEKLKVIITEIQQNIGEKLK
jgi:GT2 family glycosyltransferase